MYNKMDLDIYYILEGFSYLKVVFLVVFCDK